MENIVIDKDFESYLLSRINIAQKDLYNLLDELSGYFNREVQEFIQERHFELQQQGLKNNTIFQQIQKEIQQRRFCAPELTIRQIRRIIYG